MNRLIASILVLTFLVACNSSGSDAAPAVEDGAVLQGIDGLTDQLGQTGSVMLGSSSLLRSRDIQIAEEAATQCTIHADPGKDGDSNGDNVVNGMDDPGALNGVIDDQDRLSEGHIEFALRKMYCTLALESKGPETVSGAMSTLKSIVCALEKQTGADIPFDGVSRNLTGITFDLQCADQEELDDMGCTPGATSITLPFVGTWISNTDTSDEDDFPELDGTNYYNHAIRLDGEMGQCEERTGQRGEAQPFVVTVAAKFEDGADDPSEGDFEFATFVNGLHGPDRSEVTTGKILRSEDGETGELWFEYRDNRIGGEECGEDCNFSRHIRINTNVGFDEAGDIESLTNLSGLIADVYDDSKGPTGYAKLVTARGSSGTGITGSYDAANVNVTLATTYDDVNGSTILSCVDDSDRKDITVGACAADTEYQMETTDVLGPFFLPGGVAGDNLDWFQSLAGFDGIGFAGEAEITSDGQFANPGP